MTRQFVELQQPDGSWKEITQEEFKEHERKWHPLRPLDGDLSDWCITIAPDEPHVRHMIEYDLPPVKCPSGVIVMTVD